MSDEWDNKTLHGDIGLSWTTRWGMRTTCLQPCAWQRSIPGCGGVAAGARPPPHADHGAPDGDRGAMGPGRLQPRTHAPRARRAPDRRRHCARGVPLLFLQHQGLLRYMRSQIGSPHTPIAVHVNYHRQARRADLDSAVLSPRRKGRTEEVHRLALRRRAPANESAGEAASGQIMDGQLTSHNVQGTLRLLQDGTGCKPRPAWGGKVDMEPRDLRYVKSACGADVAADDLWCAAFAGPMARRFARRVRNWRTRRA